MSLSIEAMVEESARKVNDEGADYGTEREALAAKVLKRHGPGKHPNENVPYALHLSDSKTGRLPARPVSPLPTRPRRRDREATAGHARAVGAGQAPALPRGLDHDLDDDALAYRPLPLGNLPLSIVNCARAHAAAMNLDAGSIVVPMIGALSGAIGNTAEAVIGGWREPSTLWAVLVAPSGSLKSASLDAAVAPLFDIERRARRAYEAERDDYDRAMQAYNSLPKAKRGAPPERPRMTRYRVDVTTLESVRITHADNPRGLTLVRDELAGFFGSLDRYAKGGTGSDAAGWMEMHGGRAVNVDRLSDPDRPNVYIDRPSVSIVGTIQPAIFAATLRSPAAIASGFAPRFLPISPPASAPRPRLRADGTPVRSLGADAQATDAYARTIAALYSVPVRIDEETGRVMPYAVEPDTDALRRLTAFQIENADRLDALDEDSPLRPFVAKATGTAVRIALVLQLASDAEAGRLVDRCEIAIGDKAMQAGIVLSRYFIRETLRLYARAGVDEATQSPDEALAARLPSLFTTADVKKAGKYGGEKSAARAIRRLLDKGLAERIAHGEYRRCEPPSDTARLLASLDVLAYDAPVAVGGDGAMPRAALSTPATAAATEAPADDEDDIFAED